MIPRFGLAITLLCTVLAYSPFSMATPKRIVSLNLCTDQLALMLAPREHIVSLTHLADDPEYSFMWQQAQGIASNDGLAEQVIPLNPDLILAGDYSSTEVVSMLKRLNYPVEMLPLPQSLAEIETFTIKIGELLGQEQKAQALLAQMHQRIEQVQKQASQREKKLAVLYAPNGFTAGKQQNC